MVDDGGRSSKYVVSTLGAVFEYICWRVLKFTSWNYAVEVFETSAASIYSWKISFSCEETGNIKTSTHLKHISQWVIIFWSISMKYDLSTQIISLQIVDLWLDLEKHEALTCLCTNGRFLHVFLTHLEWLKITLS